LPFRTSTVRKPTRQRVASITRPAASSRATIRWYRLGVSAVHGAGAAIVSSNATSASPPAGSSTGRTGVAKSTACPAPSQSASRTAPRTAVAVWLRTDTATPSRPSRYAASSPARAKKSRIRTWGVATSQTGRSMPLTRHMSCASRYVPSL